MSLIAAFIQLPTESVQTTPGTQATTTAMVVRVIDGDTIDVLIDEETARVRYIGIDTPEPYRDGKPACFAEAASAANSDLVAGKKVQLVADAENTDRYDRLLRYVYADGQFVNATLLEEGYATTLPIQPNTRYAKLFKVLENEARTNNRGLWQACQ